ncbi:MAG: helix-turn-helix domain-containing protein [Anaeroplasmataceae bacterium]
MKCGEYLNEARRKKGLSQENVADELGVSRQSVSLWETNQTSPTLENLEKLSKLYEVPISFLLGEKKENIGYANTNDKRERDLKAVDSRNYTIISIITAILSCFTFVIPGLGLIVCGITIIFSIMAYKKIKRNINILTFIVGIVYILAFLFMLFNGDTIVLWS